MGKIGALHRVLRDWSNSSINLFYNFLKNYSRPLIRDREDQDKEGLPLFIKKEVTISPPWRECRLCGQDQDSGDVLIPAIIEKTYRLELKSAGLFICQETGIKFQVTGPTVIDYHLESWSDHLTDILGGKYEIIGPLFSITSTQPGMVSAVYLPHYLCLKGFSGSTSWIKCAHYKDDNLVLKTPTRIEPYYVVLENPTFSMLGILLYPLTLMMNEIRRHIPYHGIVLIYQETSAIVNLMESKIHLYLAPSTPSVEKVVDFREQQFMFLRIHKPPQTESLYINKRYVVTGPQGAHVKPKTLRFEPNYETKVLPFTEIRIRREDTDEDIGDLSVVPEDEDAPVWETELTKGDITTATSSRLFPLEGAEHFVDRHREALIQRLTSVGPILDGLLQQGALSSEQYDAVRSHPTSQEKMRELYSCFRGWGRREKDIFYQLLARKNGPLIRDLQRCPSHSLRHSSSEEAMHTHTWSPWEILSFNKSMALQFHREASFL